MTELKIHRGIKHPQICFFEKWFEDDEKIYILIELCHNKTLGQLIERRGRLH